MWGLVTAGRTPILSGWLAAIHTSRPTLVNLIFLFTSNFWYLSMRVFVFLYFHTSWPTLVNLVFLYILVFPKLVIDSLHCAELRLQPQNPRKFWSLCQISGGKTDVNVSSANKILDSRNLHKLRFIFLIGCCQRFFCSLVIFRNILMILDIMINIGREEMADNLSETNQQKKGEVTLPKG